MVPDSDIDRIQMLSVLKSRLAPSETVDRDMISPDMSGLSYLLASSTRRDLVRLAKGRDA